MTAATIRASAAYRKRQAAKMKRYEAALRRIEAHDDFELTNDDLSQHDRQAGWDAAFRLAADIARAALQEPSDDR